MIYLIDFFQDKLAVRAGGAKDYEQDPGLDQGARLQRVNEPRVKWISRLALWPSRPCRYVRSATWH